YADARLEVGSTQLRTAGSRSHSFKGSFLARLSQPPRFL
ncbi:APOL3 isoform 13, partial [Pan troglodytes]